MPGVTKEGKIKESYGYDVGGKVEKIGSAERGEKAPSNGSVGRLDEFNTNRTLERKSSNDGPSPTYAKTGYESKAFTAYGCVKSAPKSDVKFLESDGTWAPAEGRGSK